MSESGAHSYEIAPDTEEVRERARLVVESGGVLAFRTDTFYGLGADPFSQIGVERINRLKEREGRKPVLLVIHAHEEASRFISEKTELFDALSVRYWPGALTLVCKARPDVLEGITAGSGTIGLRVPGERQVREFICSCGGALTATSANLAGEPPARTALEVARYFPNELDLIVDGGEARTDKPSTVIDVTRTSRARLIREGEIPRFSLEQTLKAIGAELE
ncbi:MAG TPA: L-threonylcarbamoyladenylate synthase [Pyrinomonadaceae bacterium]|nr:L-threonylcarbamoyladenylate synthase [Pyrinomonadaceae bacterium]